MATTYTPSLGMDGAAELALTFRFLDLPVELQAVCLETLCEHCRERNGTPSWCMDESADIFECRWALARFCFASRHCRRLAQPILHHRVQVGRMDQRRVGKLGPLLRPLRTMVMRPDLTAQVRTIALDLDVYQFDLPLTQDERRTIMDAADLLQVSHLEHLIPGQVSTWIATPVTLRTSQIWAHLRALSLFRRYAASVLVAFASNATTLDIKNCGRVDEEFEPLMHVAFTNQLKLKLRRLRIGSRTPHRRSFAEIAIFFRLAPIAELSVTQLYSFICPHTLGPGGIPHPVKALALTRLDLVDTELTANDFTAVVQHCPNLEHLATLAFRPARPNPQWPGAAPFYHHSIRATPREISQILSHSPVRHKLKTLLIECPREFLAQDTPGTIGTLHGMTALTRLIIGGNALLGSYKSPENPNWQREHGEGDARLANILPPNLLHLDMFNLAYHPGVVHYEHSPAYPPRGVYDDAEMTEFLEAYMADVAREREQTGVHRPRALQTIGIDRSAYWKCYMLPTFARPQDATGRFFCDSELHLPIKLDGEVDTALLSSLDANDWS